MNLKEKLIKIEDKLDKLNGDYGTEEGYCIFCYAKKYNSTIGIIHDKCCVIVQIRSKIYNLE